MTTNTDTSAERLIDDLGERLARGEIIGGTPYAARCAEAIGARRSRSSDLIDDDAIFGRLEIAKEELSNSITRERSLRLALSDAQRLPLLAMEMEDAADEAKKAELSAEWDAIQAKISAILGQEPFGRAEALLEGPHA